MLSGPSFAQEVAAGRPTAMTIACIDTSLAARLQEALSGPALRLYTNDDVIGVELGGALKNVIAIATGIVEASDSAITARRRSSRAASQRSPGWPWRAAAGAKPWPGLAGLGDLVLTCTGDLSRNRRVGIELGKGRHLGEILAGMGGKVAEGVQTTRAALGLADTRHRDAHHEQVDAILHHGKSPREAVAELMRRPGRDEL